jgi:hypothetical protein
MRLTLDVAKSFQACEKGTVRTFVSLIALALAGVVTAAPAEAARSWNPATPFRAAGGETMGTQALTYTSNGELLALWTPDSTGFKLAARPRGGAFGASRWISTDGVLQDVAVDARGGAFIAWWLPSTNQVQVVYRRSDGTVGTPETLDAYGQGAALSANARGDVALAVGGFDPETNTRVVQTSIRPAGGHFGPLERLSSGSDRVDDVEVELLDDGSALLAWAEGAWDGPSTVMSAVRSAGGAAGTPVAISSPERDSSMPTLAADSHGNAFVLWVDNLRYAMAGPVVASYRPAGGAWRAPWHIGGATNRPPMLSVSDAGEALGEYTGMWPDGPNAAHGMPPGVAIGSTQSGALSTQASLLQEVSWDTGMVTNPHGDALFWSTDFFYGYVQIWGRPSGGPIGQAQQLRCPGEHSTFAGAALDPWGQGTVVSGVAGRGLEVSDNRLTAEPEPVCPVAPPPARAKRTTRAKRRGLHLQARLPHSGRMLHGRTLTVSATCRERCLLRASGYVRVGRGHRLLRYKVVKALLKKPGTRRVGLRLKRSDARALMRALGRHRKPRAKVLVWARGVSGGERSLTFRVPVWR